LTTIDFSNAVTELIGEFSNLKYLHRATKFISKDVVVRVTRVKYKRTGLPNKRRLEFVVQCCKPNYKERAFIKRYKSHHLKALRWQPGLIWMQYN